MPPAAGDWGSSLPAGQAADRRRTAPAPPRGSWLRPWVVPLTAAPLLLFLLTPLFGLLLKSPPGVLLAYLGDTSTRQALSLSLSTSLVSVGLILLFGTPLAYALARGHFRGRHLLEVLVDLPTVLPPAVAGLALLITFGRRGLIGGALAAAGVQVAFTPLAVVLAQVFVAAPLYIKTASVSLAVVSQELENAAALDGAGAGETLRYITLPLAWRGLAGGSALSWARALGEFGATIIFAGNYPGRTQTMPLAVYLGLEVDLNRALTLGAILLAASFLVLVVTRLLLQRAAPDP